MKLKRETVGIVKIFHFQNEIEISDLTFSYGEKCFRELFSKNKKGRKKVAFVGLSGSGKSTLINLLLGLYPVDPGMIKIDGQDINDISLASLRGIFGLVSQDIFSF